jgi:hypothetical protein
MKKNEIGSWLIYGFIALLIFGGITISFIGQFINHSYNDVKITDKAVKNSKEKSTYLIFTEDKNRTVHVFKDTDSFIRGKFNSSDIYGELKVGKTYDIETYGIRIPFLSRYENIKTVNIDDK